MADIPSLKKDEEAVAERRRSARLAKEDAPEPSAPGSASASASTSASPAGGNSSPTSSEDEDSNKASVALLRMKRGKEIGDCKRRRSTEAVPTSPTSKKKKIERKPVGDIRPTACFGSYYSFMKNIEPRMRKWHWDAYKGSNFVHYVLFGPPARDRPVLEHVLSHYVENKNKDEFSFLDFKTGASISVRFDEEWVEAHTGFPIDGELIQGNRDPHNRLWREYFEEKKEMLKAKSKGKSKAKGKAKKAKGKSKAEANSMRRYVEELLERLVESTSKKDIEDFVLLQILYQCAMIWCPNSSQGIPRMLFQYVDSIERVKRIAWGKFFFDETKRGIQIALEGMEKPGVTYVPGCMPLIPLWYYEMTGIKKPALNLRWKPPLTNWVTVGGKTGSMRRDTIETKAENASIEIVEPVISPLRPRSEKYSQRKPSLRKVAQMKRKVKPVEVKEKAEKTKDGSKSSIGYIFSQHISNALDREDEVEKLSSEDQIHFWRNTAKLNWKLLHAVKRSKRYQWDACSKEIHRLNKKLEEYEGTGDLIDPEDLKKRVKKLMTQTDRHTKAAQKKKKSVMDSVGRDDDVGCFDYGDVTNIGKEASHLAEDVMHREKNEGEEVRAWSTEIEKEQNAGKEGDGENQGKHEEKKEGENEEEKKEEEKKEEQEKEEKSENLIVAPASKTYQKRTKKVVAKPGRRPPSVRVRTRSQLVRTPFTEEKKRGVDEEIIEVPSHQKTEEGKIIKYYCKPDECSWEFLKDRKIKKKEEALLKLLNEGIPDVSDFSIRLVDSEGTFIHNFRICDYVAAKLTADENRWLSNFNNQKFHQSCNIITTANSSIDARELLYLLRGGRLDDHVTEALLDRVRAWLERPENTSLNQKYGVVSTYFCHSLYAKTPDFSHMYASFIQKHIAADRSILLIPLVRQDHWHLAEVRLDEDVVKHYSSSGHSGYVEPVNKVINFMDHMKSGFDPVNVWRQYRYEAVPSEQQSGFFDCGIFVPLFMRAILLGLDTIQVTTLNDESGVIRARLAADLLREGWEQKNQLETVDNNGEKAV